MTILVCGGRDYNDVISVNTALYQVLNTKGIDTIIEGGANGADCLACQWAKLNNIPCKTFKADWDKYGKAAGHIRNRRMLVEGCPDGVIAFPGGRGTADMIRQAEKEGIKVWKTGGWK